ncbi:PIG-L deacetylase family protein [Marinospirillum insulare]|uniref:GlcNAc-PI de-N-acetylase n=1 Tax=Marinospirillum insulare TaxID=217169 RepID=A0ABQ5ZYI8_9GAMM|nr:PIG-L deacetylase family protein [Marinospirillum insulare]GLR63048.1 GlcNAc-PI de-N-acetylase [Marinospirillum insulare]
MNKILVIAPHADDETLGCAGALLRHKAEGCQIHWLLVTGMSEASGFSKNQITTRNNEIKLVAEQYGFDSVSQLGLPPAALETLPIGKLIGGISKVINEVKPQTVYVTYRNDAHSDHELVFDAAMSATKSFRYPFIKRVLAYETISETDFGMKPEDGGFRPNVYVDISAYIQKKLDIMEIYQSEMGNFPFPRSRKALEALATLRGAQSNCHAAEAFMLIKEII